VLDIVQKRQQPGELWLRAAVRKHGLIARDVCISAVTPMAVRRELARRVALIKGGSPDPLFSHDDLLQMTRNTDLLIRDYAGDDRIIPISSAIADRWGDLLEQKIEYQDDAGETYAIGSVQKLEIATAIVGRDNIGYLYVERAQNAFVGINGLVIEALAAKVA
jgi:hypothetical protein